MTPTRIAIIIGSTREGRQGERVARWFHDLARARPELSTELLDLADMPLPYYRHPQPAKMAETGYPDGVERDWSRRLATFDGFVIVTPEYNHGYPAVLKSSLDVAYSGWNGKPVGFVSYGGSSGGVRAVEQLRLVAIELQLAPVRDEVNIPFIGRAFDASGAPTDGFHAKRAAALLDQITWWSHTLRDGRARYASEGGKLLDKSVG